MNTFVMLQMFFSYYLLSDEIQASLVIGWGYVPEKLGPANTKSIILAPIMNVFRGFGPILQSTDSQNHGYQDRELRNYLYFILL